MVSTAHIVDYVEHALRQMRSEYGLLPVIGVELEFYILPAPHTCRDGTLCNKGVCDGIDSGSRTCHDGAITEHDVVVQLDDVVDHIATAIGAHVERERGKHQYEVVVQHTHDMRALWDKIYCTKSLISSIVSQYNMYADFSPKPIATDYGSGMHYHFTLHNALDMNNNIFDVDELLLQSVMAVILQKLLHILPWLFARECNEIKCDKHDRVYNATHSFRSCNCTTCGSAAQQCAVGYDAHAVDIAAMDAEYSRFVPGFMAPTNVSWGGNNRTTAIRIPDNGARRIEFRLPSASSSPCRIVAFLLGVALHALRLVRHHRANEFRSGESGVRPLQLPQLPKRIYGNAYDEQYMLGTAFHNGKLPASHAEAMALFDITEIENLFNLSL